MAVDPTSKVYAWTPMIRLSDMKYPVYLSDFLKEHTNVSIGSYVWEKDMRDLWGYCMVHDSEVPVGDVVTEGKPELNEEDDLWYKTWVARDFYPEEIAENLARAKEDHRVRAYQQYTADLTSGVTVDGQVFSVEPRELINLDTIKAYAQAHPDDTILIRTSDFGTLSLPSAEAVEKINTIMIATGKVHQNLLAYVKTVYDTEVITDIPEVPQTFVGE
ncbi:hypothetical protein [Enterobacter hormaechei]|uniref:hypothetical protein n=1 Tax=Enterobacter hormaechei TaxID=158836 RepID=UPI0030765A28